MISAERRVEQLLRRTSAHVIESQPLVFSRRRLHQSTAILNQLHQVSFILGTILNLVVSGSRPVKEIVFRLFVLSDTIEMQASIEVTPTLYLLDAVT